MFCVSQLNLGTGHYLSVVGPSQYEGGGLQKLFWSQRGGGSKNGVFVLLCLYILMEVFNGAVNICKVQIGLQERKVFHIDPAPSADK